MSKSYVESADAFLKIGNDKVELKLDAKTGFVRDIHSKETGLHHKAESSGIWPFGLRMGDGFAPDLLRVQIDDAEKSAKQEMQYEVLSADGGTTLRMTYEDMFTTGGTRSGVMLTVHITIHDDADYFLITADVENHGKYEITSIYSGWGGLTASEDRTKECFAIPEWGLGTICQDPRGFFPDREAFGYPMYGSRGCMTAGWLDLYSDEGGIGIGYLNKQELTMYFIAQSQPIMPLKLGFARDEGVAFNWQLLNLLHDKTTEMIGSVGGIYPVRPGESFSTDTWILAPHAGDWHRMADIYRNEYEKTFAGDYVTWEDTDENAKQADLAVYTVVYVNEESPDGFRAIAPAVKEAIAKSGVAPENLVVSLLVFWNKAPILYPDHFPCGRDNAEEAIEECRKAVAEVRAMGVEAVMLFTHMFFNHPDAREYVPEADTGYDHQSVIWDDSGHVACVEQTEWQNIWKDRYIPGFASLGFNGMLLDQGPVAHLVCGDPHHVHGTDAAKMLGSFSRGTDMQIKAFRDAFTERGCFLWSECSGDIPTRNVDMWAGGTGAADAVEEGTLRTMDIVRYSFPYRLCSYAAFKEDWTVKDVNECMVKSYVAGGYFGFDLKKTWPAEIDDALRNYIRIRKELRDNGAPGYPQGFKDTVGLTVGDDHLVARVYMGDGGLTVVYYAKEDISTTIELDTEALGLGQGTRSIDVALKKDDAGYSVIEL